MAMGEVSRVAYVSRVWRWCCVLLSWCAHGFVIGRFRGGADESSLDEHTTANANSFIEPFRPAMWGDRPSLSDAAATTSSDIEAPAKGVMHRRRPLTHGHQKQPRADGAGRLEGVCGPAGHIYFAHVMKTGGISVDDYFKCRATNSDSSSTLLGETSGDHEPGISFALHEGHDGHSSRFGDPRCPISVCSAHRPAVLRQQTCGRQFEKAKVVTILREPVDRVFSFYNYVRSAHNVWVPYEPYVQRSFHEVLLALGKEDLNAGLPEHGACPFCAKQLSNVMVLFTFVSQKSLADISTWPIAVDGSSKHPSHHALSTALHEAQQTLRGLELIYFTEDLDRFPELFETKDLLPPPRSRCKIKHKNPTAYGNRTRPSRAEVERASALNWADIQLYSFAKTLPSSQAPITA